MKDSAIKFDFNDITIIPTVLSDIDSRSEINPFLGVNLPIFTAPMDMVINENNIHIFESNNINICLPRNIKYEKIKNENYFYSYGLDEIIEKYNDGVKLPKRVLIDTANAHMLKTFNISKALKEKFGNEIVLMVGNIANPETYRKYCEIGVNWLRVGIGGGSVCTTSANVSIHFAMASLINECYLISKEFENPTKIIGDGGFKNFADIIKGLALGSSAIMLGGIFNKTLESCSDTFILDDENDYIRVDYEESLKLFNEGCNLYKYYRGMSTKEVQKIWNRKELKTSEGITKFNKVEYILPKWCENFTDYLRSAMSYTGARTLNDFIGKVEFCQITKNAYERFNK